MPRKSTATRARAVRRGARFDLWVPLSGPDRRLSVNGQAPPNGHRVNDIMWPWTGTTPGYAVNAPAGVQAMLPSFSTGPIRRVRDVFDIETLGSGLGGYTYG